MLSNGRNSTTGSAAVEKKKKQTFSDGCFGLRGAGEGQASTEWRWGEGWVSPGKRSEGFAGSLIVVFIVLILGEPLPLLSFGRRRVLVCGRKTTRTQRKVKQRLNNNKKL